MYPYLVIFGSNVSSYSFFSAIGLFTSYVLLGYLLSKKLIFGSYGRICLLALLGLLLGAKLYGIISFCLYKISLGNQLSIGEAIKDSGIVFFGGLFGYLLSVYYLCRAGNLSFNNVSDSIAVCIPLFHAFGRVGCFFGGCCYGIESHILSIPYRTNINQGYVERIPVQIIEAVFEISLFIYLFVSYLANESLASPSRGTLLHKYLYAYAIFRLLIEFLRGDLIRGVLFGISFSQYICIGLLVYITVKGWKRDVSHT